MKLELSSKKIASIKADIEIVFVKEKTPFHRWVRNTKLLKKSAFEAKEEQVCFDFKDDILYVGTDSFESDSLRLCCSVALKAIGEKKFKSAKIGLYCEQNPLESLQALCEGFELSNYRFEKYKSTKKQQVLQKIIISTECFNPEISIDDTKAQEAFERGVLIAKGTNFTKEIVNTTPQDMTPKKLAKLASDTAKETEGLSCIIYDEKFLQEQKMGAFLAVARASSEPARLIHLQYKPKKSLKKIALVGKGLTYDSGGLSLKPSNYMTTMKSDKSGACTVLGIIKAAASLELPFTIDAYIGACENMIGGNAYKNDDVLYARNGKTIEVRNTDAEGRLVLADVLDFAQEKNPDYLIDFATLTGACVVALGEYTSGIMGHSDELKCSFVSSALKSGELVGTLPFNKYLKKLLKSEVADLSNISSSSYGGAITAGLFLDNFIQEKNKDKWLHVDIAGPAYLEKAWGYNQSGASGAGVRMGLYWLVDMIKKEK